MNQVVFTRQQFYDLVWSESLLSISKKYRISDVGFRKICLRRNIPLPKAGHWAKIKAGQRVSEKALPTSTDDKAIKLFIRESHDVNHFYSEANTLQKEMETMSTFPFTVPKTLSKPDPLIIKTQNNLWDPENVFLGNRGLIRGLSGGGLNVFVSKATINRALCFMDTFIKLMRLRGHDIKIEDGKTYILIKKENLQITLKEKLRMVQVHGKSSWGNTEYHLSGVLALKMEGFFAIKEWQDRKLSIEEQLPKILAVFEVQAEIELKERLECINNQQSLYFM